MTAPLPMTDYSAALAQFAATLRYEDIPRSVVRRAEELLVDWFGSALGGAAGRPVRTIVRFAQQMGGAGACEVLVSRAQTTPLLAAMANGASSHFAEQDDVHNGSVFHPATVVFPATLAAAQAIGASGRQLLTASIVGYEVGIRVGEFLGRSHYKVFHTTGTAGTVAAAAAVARLLGLSAEQTLDAIGSAGTQAAGLWEFLRDAADSKQLHTANAAAKGLRSCEDFVASGLLARRTERRAETYQADRRGPSTAQRRQRAAQQKDSQLLMAAWLARDGFTAARHVLEGPQGMAAGMSSDADPLRLVDRLGTRWATAETSFKWHASCRHTHPAADALLAVMRDHALSAERIESVTAHVHQAAIDVLGPVTDPATVHQSKFSMGTVLALAARHGHAGLQEFEREFRAPATIEFRNRVRMELDPEVDAAYPRRWVGKVTVKTTDGRTLHGRIDEPKGDPGNTLTRAEIEGKALRLAAFGGTTSETQVRQAIARLWRIAELPRVGPLLGEA